MSRLRSKEEQSNKLKCKQPISLILLYCGVGAVFFGVGIWLTIDLISSRSSIIAERSALAVQTSGLISQRFGNIITATDYVLRDVTTKVAVDELDLASSDHEVQERLSAFVREKLTTLPNVYGLGFLDKRCVFVAAADERLIGIQSNSKLHVDKGQVLKNQAYVEYVPATKSANKQPAILVSRPILSSDGHFLGGALAAIMLSSTQDWIETFNIGEYDTLAMVDGNGTLLASNPSKHDAIGTQLRYWSNQPNVSNQLGSTSYNAVSALDGRERIYGISQVEGIPLYIIVGFDIEHALREWRQRLWQLLVGYITLLIAAGMMLRKQLEVLAQRDKMQMLSITDPLTGVANRRQLTSRGEAEFAQAVRYKRNVSVLMVDIDHFKSINDTWGHPTGDRAIRFLADAMVLNLRNTDIVGRLGGDEFAAVMPETDSEGAIFLANRLREYVENSINLKVDEVSQVCFTISIGVASKQEGDSSFEHILGRVDRALYDAKCLGRNRVVLV